MSRPLVDTTSLEYRACLRKKKFGTEGSALAVANAPHRKPKLRLWVYQCRFCRCWHLTSSPPRVIA